MKRAFVLLLSALACCGQTTLVSSFEDDEQLSVLRPRNTRVEVVTHGATDGGKALKIDFEPVQWPSLWFSPAAAFDLREYGEIVFDITNPMDEPLLFRVRVDDDPRADGTRYCRTGGATIQPGETATFAFPLKLGTPADYGMRGLPSWPETRSLGSSGSWTLDLSHIVAFQIFLSSPAGVKTLIVDNVRFRPAPPLDGIVDRFGQYSYADWPGKLYTMSDFEERREAERADLEAHPSMPDRDRSGGWSAGPRQEATGYFRTTQIDGKWWLVTPDGSLFFSIGQDGMRPFEYTFLTGRERMFTWLPEPGDPLRKYVQRAAGSIGGATGEGAAINWYGLNVERKYGPDFEQWASAALKRVRSWGFNTIANWSDARLFRRDVPYVVPGGIGGTHNRIVVNVPSVGSSIHDPWDQRFAVNVRNSLRAQAEAAKGDPMCLGYFVDNELPWGNRNSERDRYAVATGALAQNHASSPAKQAFAALLRMKYGAIENLNAAWRSSFSSWETVSAPAVLNDEIRQDYSVFVKEHARLYFRIVRDELKALDPDHLYLGARFAGSRFTNESLEACAEYCDIVSFNVYERQIAASNWSFLSALSRPAIIGEFHFGALDRGMFHTGLQAAADQNDRARLYQGFVRSVLDHPVFVGCHWFIAADQPLTGRVLDGENYNIGFVTITDTPYPEMVEAAREVHSEMYQRRAGRPAPYTTW